MMANYQLVFITRNRHRRKVKFFNFKRLKLSACLMLFFLAFGLTQNIANAANNSSNSNIDLLDCNHDEKVRLFLDPIFCIKPGYKEKTKSGYKERAEIVSDRLAYFVRSEISPEYLILNPCENNLTTCFDLSYKEPKSNKDINIISIQKEDIEYLLPEQYNNQNQDIDLETQIKTTILPRIKEAVKNFRESQCQLTTQAVTIELNEVTQTLFCIKTSIRDDENISERAKRITEKIKKIQEGNIDVETLGIVKVADLKEKFGISEFENLTDSTQEEKSDEKKEDSQPLAIVSYQEKLSQDDRIIFILTKLDLELINSKDNNYSTIVQAIDNYFHKIVTLVRISDNKERKPVYFDWGSYNNILFRRLNSLNEQQPIESQEYLFEVHNKAGFYNPSYRAETIGNNISTLANERWRIFRNPKLDIQHEDNQSIIKLKKNHIHGDDSNIIMTIAEDDTEKDNAKTHSLTIESTIRQAIHMYRYSQWLVLEIIFLSATSAVYFFHLDKTK